MRVDWIVSQEPCEADCVELLRGEGLLFHFGDPRPGDLAARAERRTLFAEVAMPDGAVLGAEVVGGGFEPSAVQYWEWRDGAYVLFDAEEVEVHLPSARQGAFAFIASPRVPSSAPTRLVGAWISAADAVTPAPAFPAGWPAFLPRPSGEQGSGRGGADQGGTRVIHRSTPDPCGGRSCQETHVVYVNNGCDDPAVSDGGGCDGDAHGDASETASGCEGDAATDSVDTTDGGCEGDSADSQDTGCEGDGGADSGDGCDGDIAATTEGVGVLPLSGLGRAYARGRGVRHPCRSSGPASCRRRTPFRGAYAMWRLIWSVGLAGWVNRRWRPKRLKGVLYKTI